MLRHFCRPPGGSDGMPSQSESEMGDILPTDRGPADVPCKARETSKNLRAGSSTFSRSRSAMSRTASVLLTPMAGGDDVVSVHLPRDCASKRVRARYRESLIANKQNSDKIVTAVRRQFESGFPFLRFSSALDWVAFSCNFQRSTFNMTKVLLTGILHHHFGPHG